MKSRYFLHCNSLIYCDDCKMPGAYECWHVEGQDGSYCKECAIKRARVVKFEVCTECENQEDETFVCITCREDHPKKQKHYTGPREGGVWNHYCKKCVRKHKPEPEFQQEYHCGFDFGSEPEDFGGKLFGMKVKVDENVPEGTAYIGGKAYTFKGKGVYRFNGVDEITKLNALTGEEEPMSVTRALKNLVKSPDQKLLEKHGVVDECGDITGEGARAVIQTILNDPKSEIRAQLLGGLKKLDKEADKE